MSNNKEIRRMRVVCWCSCRLSLLLWLCTFSFMSVSVKESESHFIHIDHNEFRASGFPRPHMPPPLPPPEQLSQQVPAKELTPAELMVDLTNDLTNRILHYHSILNRNNFAFSPTALMSVLVALYEGSSGRSAKELKNVLLLPTNRDIIRVGYRDIHRRLRTYFFGSDNPLKGLSLNKENVTVSRDFETVLMFYGYDLAMDMTSSIESPTTPESTTVIINSENSTIAGNVTSPLSETEATTIKDTETTTGTSMTDSTTTEVPKTTTEETTTEVITTSTAETTEEGETEATTEVGEGGGEGDGEGEGGGENEAAELVSAFVASEADAEPLLRIQKARVTRLPTSKLQAPLKQSYPITPKPNYLPSARSMAAKPAAITSKINITSTRPGKLVRHKRHFLSYKELDAGLFVSLFNPQTPHPHPHPNPNPFYSISSAPATGPAFAHLSNEFELDVDPHFIGEHTQNKQNYNTDVISHVFYLGNQQIVHTTFKVYNAVLYFKYFDHLKMSVLELELDTPEYNLMILLPDYHTDIVAATASLKLGPTLRILRKQLKPRWVQSIIPDFKLHGSMFLTNDLQNMGICDIFEPNRADFRPMTEEKGIYVRHIEQSINVSIRTRPINQLKRNYGTQTKPIQISVNHPFLFFIIDRDLDVAVMAGRILNPLNVRIQ